MTFAGPGAVTQLVRPAQVLDPCKMVSTSALDPAQFTQDGNTTAERASASDLLPPGRRLQGYTRAPGVVCLTF
jgi:hypothetical protein